MHRHLCDAVDFLWLRQAGSLQDRWSDVCAVSELAAQPPLSLMRPGQLMTIGSRMPPLGHLLSPFKRRVPGPRPRCRVVRIHVRAAPFFEATVSFNCF